MNRKTIRTILSLTLAIVMVFTTVGSVFAETITEPVVVKNGEEIIINADVVVESQNSNVPPAVNVTSYDEKQWDSERQEYITVKPAEAASATINGDVSETTENEYSANVYGVFVQADGKTADAEAKVTGDVTASSSSENLSASSVAVEVVSESGGEASATITGNAIANAKAAEDSEETTISVYGSANGEGSITNVSIGGKSEGDVKNISRDEGTTTVTVGNGVEGIVEATAEEGSTSTIIVKAGGVTSEQEGSTAVSLDNDGANITGNITGNITSEGNGIFINNGSYYKNSKLESTEYSSIKDKLITCYEETVEGHTIASYDYYDEVNHIYYQCNTVDGEFKYGYKDTYYYEAASTTLDVTGNLTASRNSENWTGVTGASVTTNYDGTLADLGITGDVIVTNKNGYSTGVSLNANDASNLQATIGGGITVSGTTREYYYGYETKAVSVQNEGAQVDLSVGGEVTSSGYGIYTSNSQNYEEKVLAEADVASFRDKAVQNGISYYGDEKRIKYSYESEDGKQYSFYIRESDGAFVSAKVRIPSENDSETNISVKGAINAGGTGISANNSNGTMTISAGGDLTAGGTGIYASGSDGKTTITAGGNVTATSEKNSISGIYASASGKDSEINIGVTGDVSVTGSEQRTYDTEGIDANNTGAKVNVTVGGEVSSNGRAVVSANKQAYDRKTLTESDIASIRDKAVQNGISYYGDEKRITYSYESDDGKKYSFYIRESDGAFVSAYVDVPAENDSETTIRVKGDITGGDAGIYADNANGKMTINAGSDVNAVSEKGSAKGVYAKANGGDSELTIDVAGDISATGAEKNRYETYGIDSQNTGSGMAITVGGDVSSSSYGISAINNGMYTQKAMKETDVAAIKDKARLTYTQDNGNKGYYYKDENGNEYSYTVNGDGSLISGTVKTPSKEESNTSITVKGSVNAGNSGLSTINNKGTMSADIGKDVTASGEYSTYGVSASDCGGETDIKIGGNVTSVTTGLEARGVNLHTNDEDAVLNLSVAGSVIAEATGEEEFIEYEGEEGGYYRRREVRSLLVDNDAGTVNATVAGDVSSNQEGVYVNHDRYNDWRNITEEEASAIVDKAELTDSGTGEDEEGNTYEYKHYTYTDEDGYEYNFTLIDGKFDWGEKQKIIPKKAVTNIEIGGNVDVSNQEGVTRGLYADIDNGEATINIKGAINAEGVASLEDDYHGREYVDGIRGEVYGANSELTINVEGGITQKSLTLLDEDNGSAISVGNDADDDGLGKLTVTVMDDVTATGTGIYVNSGDHEREYLEGTAVINEAEYLRTQKYAREDGTVKELKIYYNQAGDYYYDEDGTMWKEKAIDEGFTKVKVVGDVHGDDNGIHVDEGINAAVIVDGTLTGDNSAILLSNDIIDDNMVLTVWEVIPDADDNIVERVIGYDEDGKEIRAQDRDTELQIQYIIRINPADASYITTEGTTDYEGYKVAREGDTVTLRLNIPAGYVVDGAFGDLGQNFQLLQDANGNYYLVVPRGGAVLLSLKMHRVAARTAKVTYDPNGGVVGGHDQAYTVKVILNKNIELPTPDEREGYEFVGWYGADYGKDDERWAEPSEDDTSIVKAGATVKVEKDITYTAIWKTK